MRAARLAICGLLTLTGVPMAMSAHSALPTPSAVADGQGMAIATVLHPGTRQPLVNMPVTVEAADIPPDTDGGVPLIFSTGRDGRATIGPLKTGDYIAYVNYNNHVSNVVSFHINADTDTIVMFTLYFNPYIDGK